MNEKPTATLVLEVTMIQNMLTFLQRVEIKGSEAPEMVRLVDAVMTQANNQVQNPGGKQTPGLQIPPPPPPPPGTGKGGKGGRRNKKKTKKKPKKK